MLFDWTPGKRTSRLPRFLRFPALLLRNLRDLPHNWRVRRRVWYSRNARAVSEALALSVEYICSAGVTGDVAEFGTMTGKTAVDLARALAAFDDSRTLLLFDSFEGLPAAEASADVEAPHVQAGTWSAGTCRGVTSRQLLRMCRRYLAESRIRIREGWFSETLPALEPQTRLALLHVDSDLYQSARDVLEHCFGGGVISPGAAVHFDDWDCNRADPRFGERRAWAEAVDRFAVEFSDCGQYGWGGRKFLVHAYRGVQAE